MFHGHIPLEPPPPPPPPRPMPRPSDSPEIRNVKKLADLAPNHRDVLRALGLDEHG